MIYDPAPPPPHPPKKKKKKKNRLRHFMETISWGENFVFWFFLFFFQNVVCLIFWFESRTTEAIVDQLPFEKGHYSIRKQQTPRSDCAMSTSLFRQYILLYPLYIRGQQGPWSHCTNAQANPDIRFIHKRSRLCVEIFRHFLQVFWLPLCFPVL